nr:uncharacterized protein LOC100180546 [Ciona intestinalis]|eukprot:XP_002127797.1 uncharacterized protein LOC100180546 [Ciona intestinalis]
MYRMRNCVLFLINASLFGYYFLLRNTEVLPRERVHFLPATGARKLLRLHGSLLIKDTTITQSSWDVFHLNDTFEELDTTGHFEGVPALGKGGKVDRSRDVGDRKCLKSATNWNKPVTPKHRLDPNRFLIPTVINGPSNQLAGFQQSALLAILLNRTLVLPNFYEHQPTEDTFLKTVVDAGSRIDLDILRRFMSVIPMSQAVKECNGRFDIFFNAEEEGVGPLMRYLPAIHLQSGIRGARYKEGIGLKEVEEFLKEGNTNMSVIVQETGWLMGDLIKGKKHKIDFMELKSHFKSPEKCAHYLKPFRQLGLRPNDTLRLDYPRTSEQILNSPQKFIQTKKDAEVFFSAIWRNVQSPKFIRDVAKDFSQSVLGGKYFAVHWRYDKVDFLHYLCGVHYRPQIADMCNNIKRAAKPKAIARAIAVKLSESKEIFGSNPRSVYLAAPSSVSGFVEAIKTSFDNLLRSDSEYKSLGKVKMYFAKDLFEFVLKNYRPCGHTSNEHNVINDVISQVEMEIGKLSETFVWSKQSTWSQRVLFNRKLHLSNMSLLLDQNIIGLVLDTLDGGRGHRKLMRELHELESGNH